MTNLLHIIVEGGTCVPEMSWHLVRHGTRNPGSKVIKRMKKLLPVLRQQILEGHKLGKGDKPVNNQIFVFCSKIPVNMVIFFAGNLCSSELAELEAWDSEPLPVETNEKILVRQGQKELLQMSNRFKQMFPNIYASNYHNDTFKV